MSIEAPIVEPEYYDDEGWIQRIPTDPHAFEVIYDRYLPRVYRFIYRKVGDQAETEDLTSVVFLQALIAIMQGQYSSRSKFAAWLFSIARAKIADHFRESQKAAWVEINEDLKTPGPQDFTEESRDLSRCFSELSHAEQELLALRFSADLDFSTMASILHKSTAAVKMATYRSLNKLRKRLEGLYE